MRKPQWAAWVRKHREAVGMSRGTLAAKVNVHPSYVTLFERDGYVPKYEIAQAVAMLLCPDDKIEQDYSLMVAGYAPTHVSLNDMRRALVAIHEARRKKREAMA